MAANGEDFRGPLLLGARDDGAAWWGRDDAGPPRGRRSSSRPWTALAIAAALLALAGVVFLLSSSSYGGRPGPGPGPGASRAAAAARRSPQEVESAVGAAAADDARCSEVAAAALRAGGHAVDAAVAAALCLGVVHPMSSGMGGGAFVVVRDAAASGQAVAFDAREAAPAAATPDMYAADPAAKYRGALAAGVPGELAGLHAAWSRYGRLPWRDLVAPAIRLARDGYEVVPYLARALQECEGDVLADPGLRAVFAPGGRRVLAAGETCRNPALAAALERVAEEGAAALYGGAVGEALVRDVRAAGGVLTVDDLRGYRVEVGAALRADAMGFTFLGMPPPSSGTLGMALILNILQGYSSLEFLKELLGIHRVIESIKHMLAIRMDLGDPDFVDVTSDVAEMLSTTFADKVRQRIVDNTTFPPGYYFPKWSQLDDHGTSHLCVVDGDRNAVAMTTTVNAYFGAKVLSPSTGIVLNDEMDDFSVPAKRTPDRLPPAPANFIAPGKRPLSSMTPLIILKDGELAGVLGGSGGTNIIATVVQVFVNHFIVGMDPLAAVQHPRVYHKLIPNVVTYENQTVGDGEVIALGGAARAFLEERGHRLRSTDSGAVCQFIVHELAEPPAAPGHGVFRGRLTAVSDPRKGGSPAGL
ncbi:glutathione hydrolase 3 [Zea mays]|uniref:Glutathione hydrolase n=2 Tax=Zea mays TaxID=4577 RepID=A0A804QKD5_MAIZE|nr:glutathione hydrolase 3 [Zea mays]|eukprot:XP_020398122.1 glutathione hydrolase 3 [Zea mays]